MSDQKINGITGIGAIVVLLYHFCQQFLPSIITNDKIKMYFGIEKLVFNSPLYIIVNAQFFISIFWGISGFLISYNWYCDHDIKKLREKEAKKYVSFLGPFLLSTTISFVLMKTNLYYNGVLAKYLRGPVLFLVLNHI